MRTQLIFTFFLLLGAYCTAQELIGPDQTLPGTLVSFEVIPAQEASWHIVSPTSSVNTYQIDTGQSKLYFASPIQGPYAVIAGIVIDGKPELLVKTFVNGGEDNLPVPPVSSLGTWVKAQLPVLVKSENLVSESRLAAECFEHIVHRIDSNNIRTIQNAQAQLQVSLTGTLALASPTAVNDWTKFFTALSQRLETELGGQIVDLAEVKQKLQEIGDAMKLFELPLDEKIPPQNINNPSNQGQGIQNRVFRGLLAR